jgi:hypothetical protein
MGLPMCPQTLDNKRNPGGELNCPPRNWRFREQEGGMFRDELAQIAAVTEEPKQEICRQERKIDNFALG